jgi:hypothetical protein
MMCEGVRNIGFLETLEIEEKMVLLVFVKFVEMM